MDLRLEGRRALVTGSSAGIGKAIAPALAAEAELGARGGEVLAVAADLT